MDRAHERVVSGVNECYKDLNTVFFSSFIFDMHSFIRAALPGVCTPSGSRVCAAVATANTPDNNMLNTGFLHFFARENHEKGATPPPPPPVLRVKPHRGMIPLYTQTLVAGRLMHALLLIQ